jgi:Domain of unknown function (DUF4145)
MAQTPRGTKLFRIHCNNCRRKTQHRLVKKIEGDSGSEPYDEEFSISWDTIFHVLQCCGCLELVVRRTYMFSEWDQPDIRFFPPRVSRHLPDWANDLPYDLRVVLEEVYRSLDADNRRLPMMGARTLMDMVMVEKIGDVGSFKDKLKELENRKFISAPNREVLDAALDAGNAAAHRGHAAKISEVSAVMDIVENLLQAVYVLPGMAQDLKKSTPQRPSRRTSS